MESSSLYNMLAADAILLVHVMFVSFVVVGLVFILIGKVLTWSWVKNPWFRITHLASICLVVVQSWLGALCPLTTWEMTLRSKAGDVVYTGSFLSHWLEYLLYYQAPAWAFIVCYTTFGVMVMASWYWVRPHRFW
ncbi:MAG: DUF2784 domain-containing protein [Gammaproteobacteria bacterium]|nr:DUF2784 domain-containing protein [Gammaproteobacteria bacterium]